MPNLDQGYLDWLLNLDCSKIKVSGLKDGTICHPNVPLLRLEGPFALL
jgi:nicotinic acid phosphoribosyltransferase